MISSLTRQRPDPILARFAAERPVAELVTHVLNVRSPAAGLPEEDRVRAVVNANWLVEIAARQRSPADVAALAWMLDGPDEGLAALVLDTAAASREPADLAALAIAMTVTGEERLPALLAAISRRRVPADIADLLVALTEADRHAVADQLLAGVTDARDAVRIVLGLRTRHDGDLADQAARTLAAMLPPAGLAALATGLRRHEDMTSAAVVVDTTLRQEPGQVACLVRHLFGAEPQYAHAVADQAMDRLVPADRLVLASLLEEGIDPATSSAIWARIIPGLEDSTFVEAVDAFARHAGPGGVHRALREAAKAHAVERIAALVLQVSAKKIDGGVDAILSAVVQHRSVADIDALADQLRDAAWTELAAQLLNTAIAQVHERAGTGDAAELIRRLLTRIEKTERRGRAGREDLRHWRQEIPGIIARIARRREPAHLMGLVDGLVRCGGYTAYRTCLEEAVTAEYSAADLAGLPRVRGYEHLPVLLELMCGALQNQDRMNPAEVPLVVGALRSADAPDHHLATLMAWVGYRRDLDYAAVSSALEQAGLASDADAVVTGHVQRRRGRRMRQPQFFSG